MPTKLSKWFTVLASMGILSLRAADAPQFGEAWSRNMVSAERGLPASFSPETGSNVLWSVLLGTETHSTPIIAGGRIYVGTNNGNPRDSKHDGDRGVLMCFEEKSGRFLWQLVVPKREEDIFFDWPHSGISSTATAEGDRVYVVSNRGELLCLDANGMANGNDGPFRDEGVYMTRIPPGSDAPQRTVTLQPGPTDADVIWKLDLTADAGIYSHDAAHTSILIRGDQLYLNSGTGVDNTHKKIRTPDAPSLLVVDKHTGRLLARDREGMAPNIFHSTWAGPSLGNFKGRDYIFFEGGNGLVYSFEPLATLSKEVQTVRKIWQFDFDPGAPKTNVHLYNTNRRESPSNFYGMPVFYDDRLYLAGGGDLWWGKNEAWLKCIRADVEYGSSSNRLVWEYPLQKHVMASPAIWKNLVFIPDCGRMFHCVDALTGKPLWTEEIKGEVWASAFVAEEKVYFGTRSGTFYVFAASAQKQLLSEIELGKPISATATAANGVLYVATMNKLYAIAHSPRNGE
jgi:outer membrane protein assembly factor BamB